MHGLPPTSRAFADAVHYYRQLRDLSLDELSYVLAQLGHGLTTRHIERREQAATVDDLIAIAAALGSRSAILLSHIPIDMPAPGDAAGNRPADRPRAAGAARLAGGQDHPRLKIPQVRIMERRGGCSDLRLVRTDPRHRMDGPRRRCVRRWPGQVSERRQGASESAGISSMDWHQM